MQTLLNSTLQDTVEQLPNTPNLTSGINIVVVIGCIVAFLMLSLLVSFMSTSPATRWLLMTASFALVGVSGTLVYHAVKEHRAEEYQAHASQQHIAFAKIRAELVSQYEILDAMPVSENTKTEETTYFPIGSLVSGNSQDMWLDRLAQEDPFDAALVSVLLPDTHDNAVYMVRFTDDGTSVELHGTPRVEDAPLVEEITR